MNPCLRPTEEPCISKAGADRYVACSGAARRSDASRDQYGPPSPVKRAESAHRRSA